MAMIGPAHAWSEAQKCAAAAAAFLRGLAAYWMVLYPFTSWTVVFGRVFAEDPNIILER